MPRCVESKAGGIGMEAVGHSELRANGPRATKLATHVGAEKGFTRQDGGSLRNSAIVSPGCVGERGPEPEV